MAAERKSSGKKIEGYLKLRAPAGSANPSPPLGPALGQRGINIPGFCQAFNDATKDMEKGLPLPVVVTIFADKSFAMNIKTPPASFLLKRAAGLKKGGAEPGRISAGSVTMAQCREIAEVKMKNLSANDIDAAAHIIAGSARSLGLEVRDK